MAPTSIDGTEITGATIDGQDVSEITVDGETVFTAIPDSIVYDFEDGDLNGWSGGGSIDNIAYNGTYSGRFEDTATWSPSELSGGVQIDGFEFYWYEIESSSGSAITLYDSGGSEVVEMGTNNPQWKWSGGQLHGGDGYERWIRFTLSFDWGANEMTLEGHDTQSGTTKNSTTSIGGNNVETIESSNYPSWQTSGNNLWLLDDITVTVNE